ncbi:MAG: hypothetical protein J6C23_02615 [Clostridia bacterium]|nr:hypothetical protein [Clostridia bacterium]
MPTKKGAGGRQQNYDPHTGRFAKTDYAKLYPHSKPTRKEKARKREAQRRESLYNRARNSKDPLVFEVFCAIESELPGSVQFVNEIKFDPFLGKPRELDIITKRCIIEVKSGAKPSGALKQFCGQKQYAENKGKKHIVFAPKMPTLAKNEHRKKGIIITGNLQKLIQMIKEYEK